VLTLPRLERSLTRGTVRRAGLGKYRSCRVELHLCFRTYMRPPDILLKEEETVPCDSDASQYLSLTSSAVVPFRDTVKLLGVTHDSALSMDRHVTEVVRSCSYHTRALRHIRPLLTLDVAMSVGHSIVSSRLDYANALLHAVHRPATSTGCRLLRTLWPEQSVRPRALSVPPNYVDSSTGFQSGKE